MTTPQAAARARYDKIMGRIDADREVPRDPVPDRAVNAAYNHMTPDRNDLGRWQVAGDDTTAGLAARLSIIREALEWGGRLLPLDAEAAGRIRDLVEVLEANADLSGVFAEESARHPVVVPVLAGADLGVASSVYKAAALMADEMLTRVRVAIAGRKP